MRIQWNKKNVLKEIKKLYKNKIKLNYANIVKQNSSLINAANRYFGGWKKAVESCGIKYQYFHKYITKEDVVKDLKKRNENGLNLKSGYILRKHPGLYLAARKKFGSWIKAIAASGLSLDEIGYQYELPQG